MNPMVYYIDTAAFCDVAVISIGQEWLISLVMY